MYIKSDPQRLDQILLISHKLFVTVASLQQARIFRASAAQANFDPWIFHG